MSQSGAARSVFIGRQTEVPLDEFHQIRPSVEADDEGRDEYEIDELASDAVDFEGEGEEGIKSEYYDEEERPKSVAATPRRARKNMLRRSGASRRFSSAPAKRELRPRRKNTLDQVTRGAVRKKTDGAGAKTQQRKKRTSPGKPASATASAAGRGKAKEWEVEEIVGSMIEDGTLKHFYRVKWKGYASQHNTWEPKVNLANCQALVETFEKKKKKRVKERA